MTERGFFFRPMAVYPPYHRQILLAVIVPLFTTGLGAYTYLRENTKGLEHALAEIVERARVDDFRLLILKPHAALA